MITLPQFKNSAFSSVKWMSFLFILLGLQLCMPFSNAEDMLPTGIKAPLFRLTATWGKTIALSDYKGKKHLILVFYPGDNTPGCTIQLCALRDSYQVIRKLNADVLASNPASVKSHEEFSRRQNYPFPILADINHTMAKNYKVDGLFGLNRRTVYIIDKEGIIRFADRGMPSPKELLSVLKKLESSP